MRRLLIMFGLVFFILSCRKEIEPQEKAALVDVQDFTKCGGCGGWMVKVDGQTFRAELSAQFTKPNTAVWLRYERDEGSGVKKAGNWIKVLTIRERLP